MRKVRRERQLVTGEHQISQRLKDSDLKQERITCHTGLVLDVLLWQPGVLGGRDPKKHESAKGKRVQELRDRMSRGLA